MTSGGRAYCVAAAPVAWAAASASLGLFEPLSAACIAVHIAWEILGYLVPRSSLVRPLATWTASTHTFRSGVAATCLACTAWVAAMYDSVVSVAYELSVLDRHATSLPEIG